MIQKVFIIIYTNFNKEKNNEKLFLYYKGVLSSLYSLFLRNMENKKNIRYT